MTRIIIDEIVVSKDHLKDVVNNQKFNSTIGQYYVRLQEEESHLNLMNKIDSVASCNNWWLLDVYEKQGIKDFKKTNLCKDKFCNNCKKVKQASRLAQFMPLVNSMKKGNYLYHFVFTVPNCSGADLHDTIKKIFKSFTYLNDYLKGKGKVKGLDFLQYGYLGAIRSLEVTFNGDNYHPHLHCILAFDKPLSVLKNNENAFSHSRSNGYRAFSDFEILIQKIWYLLNNSIRVNQKNIDELEIGYSCTADPVDDSSAFEVFKYMTKSKDDGNNLFSYENFKTLYFALHKVRQIQGYGCFYNVKDDDSLYDQFSDIYNNLIETFQAIESPVSASETPQDLLKDTRYRVISRKTLFSYLERLHTSKNE